MKGLAGLRSVVVVTGTSGNLGAQTVCIEVTNDTAGTILFYPNDYPMQGHPSSGIDSQGIPIKAGTTREIPMLANNFVANGVVTVVAYGQ